MCKVRGWARYSFPQRPPDLFRSWMKPQMGWEVARAAAWQDYGAEGWSHLKAKRGQETKGWDLELLPILTLSPWPLPSLLCVWRHSLSPCSFLCPVGIWGCWDLYRNPFRRQVRSTLLEPLLPEIFGLNSLIRVWGGFSNYTERIYSYFRKAVMWRIKEMP